MTLQPQSEPEFHLRQYRSADLQAIFALDEICFEATYRFPLAMMRRSAEAGNALTVVVERECEIVGFCIAHVERASGGTRFGYIITLDVAPEQRRRGLAQRMMQRIEAQAREAGCEIVALHVSVSNESAISFYERAGYLRSHTVRAFYGAGLHAFVYRKRLPRLSEGIGSDVV